jgi:transposase
MERFGLRNDQWERIKDVLPGREGHVGGTVEDNRLFVEAVLYRFRTGCPWFTGAFRPLENSPSTFQPMGEKRGFRACFEAVGQRSRQRIHDDRCHHRTRSSTQRRSAKKNGPQAIGRSRGGLTTKVHALVDALGNPCGLMLTPGQDHDLTCAQPLLENADPRALIGDKAYDADSLIDTLNKRAIIAVIPPKANRKVKRDCDFVLYCERNLVERFFNKIKHYRAIATRYDKLARNFLAAVRLVAAIILLN